MAGPARTLRPTYDLLQSLRAVAGNGAWGRLRMPFSPRRGAVGSRISKRQRQDAQHPAEEQPAAEALLSKRLYREANLIERLS